MMSTFTPIFSIIIAFVVYLFFTSPTLSEVQVIKTQTAQYADAVSNAKELNQVLSNLLAKKNAYSTYDQDRLSAFVPANIDEVKQLVDIKDLAQSHSMLIGNIAVNPAKPSAGSSGAQSAVQQISGDSFTTSDISFSLIGTYAQFKDMLHDIERSLVLMEVVHLGFTANRGDLQQFEMTVRLYRLPPEAN